MADRIWEAAAGDYRALACLQRCLGPQDYFFPALQRWPPLSRWCYLHGSGTQEVILSEENILSGNFWHKNSKRSDGDPGIKVLIYPSHYSASFISSWSPTPTSLNPVTLPHVEAGYVWTCEIRSGDSLDRMGRNHNFCRCLWWWHAVMVCSERRLRRERESLCRQMQKRFSAEERESLYTKWGIALDSKQRKRQLVRRLWTETGDLQHIRESASIVAKLMGLLEPEKALKEMFGLSFELEQCNRRSFKWRHGVSSLKWVSTSY